MTALADDVAELLILIPHLDLALERDAGTSGEPTSGGADPAFRLPVNADVLAAVHTLDRRVPSLARWAADACAEPHLGRPIIDHVRHFPRWHERMLVTAAQHEAEHFAGEVADTLRYVKLALGLRTPDRRLGRPCPMHDEPIYGLITPGSVATLRYSRLDAEGQPIGVAVDWAHDPSAVCRLCGASWHPSQYLMLGRLMREADARRWRIRQENLPSEGQNSPAGAGNLAVEAAP